MIGRLVRRSALIAASMALLAPCAALAQLQPGSRAPVLMDAGGLGRDPTTCTDTLQDVQLTQDRSRLGARTIRRVEGRRGGSCNGQIERIEAEGDVFYVTPELKVRGARAVYVQASDTLTVTGDVVVDQGGNVASAQRLVIKVSTGAMTMDSPGEGSARGRVRGVLIPTPAENAAPAAP